MKVFILVDMEGITGICLEEHTSAGTPEYEQARRWMTQDVNAAVQGALDGGAREVVVLDGHGANQFYNLVFDDLHSGAEYILGTPHNWYITELDESYDCMLMVGMHAMSGTPNAVLEHTWSGLRWHSCRLNGIETGEIGLMAAYAGSFGVPVGLVTGDLAACEEAQKFLGDGVVTACVKKGLSRYSARLMPAEPARGKILQAAEDAVGRAKSLKPCVISAPYSLEVDYHRNSHMDQIKAGPGVEIISARTVKYSADTIPATFGLMR